MKTVSFSFVVKFPSKKVTDCFTNPEFAKLHTASKLFSKVGILKADKKMIVRTLALAGSDKVAATVIAVINFADADNEKSTAISATFVNVPDDKAEAVKGLGKTISADIITFLTPKPAPAKKAPAKKAAKAPAKKAKAPAKKAADKKPAAAKKPAAKAVAKKPAAKKVAAKKPAVVAKPAAEIVKN